MNKILLLAVIASLLLPTITLSGQKNVPVDSLVLQKIIEVPNVSQDELYIRVNAWFVKYFKYADSVIEFSDKENGKIIGKYVFDYTVSLNPYRSTQMVTVEVKDERLRVTIEDPYERYIGNASLISKASKPFDRTGRPLAKLRDEWRKLVESLEHTIINTVIADDNW